MKVALDIDGVLADFITPFLRLLETRAGAGSIDPASITDPSFLHHPFLTQELIVECMELVIADPDFWRTLAPLPTPQQWRALADLKRDHPVVFITHRWVRSTYDIHRITCDWLASQGLSNAVVHFTQEKKSALVNRLGVQLFVDDRHENCEDVATATRTTVFMPHRPYNRTFNHPKVRRIQELDELFDYLAAT